MGRTSGGQEFWLGDPGLVSKGGILESGEALEETVVLELVLKQRCQGQDFQSNLVYSLGEEGGLGHTRQG